MDLIGKKGVHAIRTHAVFLSIFTGFLLVILFIYRDFALSWDEPDRMYTAPVYLRNFVNATELKKQLDAVDTRLFLSYTPLSNLIVYGPLSVFGLGGDSEKVHLVMAIFSSLTVLFVYGSARKLHSGTLFAILCVLFFVLEPRWFGDMFDNFMDSLATLYFSVML